MLDLAERVVAGAKLLDEMRPGWARRIALDQLAMWSCDDCILGQLYGDFLNGLEDLGLNDPEAYGFTLSDDEADRGLYAVLAFFWRAEVRVRVSPIHLPPVAISPVPSLVPSTGVL